MPPLRLAVALLLAAGVLLADEPKKPSPKFKLGKDTTYVTGPLDKDGYIDYESALNERLKGKTTPDTNAVVLLLKCFGPKPEGADLHPDFYKALGVSAPPEKGDYLVPGSKFFAEEYRAENADEFNKLETRLRQRPWKPADSPRHVEWLKVNEKPLAVAVEATKRPDYFHPMISRNKDGSRGQLIGALLPMALKMREIASMLSFRVSLKLAAGKPEEALADALAMHRLSRLGAKGGSLIELLVGIAIESIAHNSELEVFEFGKLTAKQALAYQAELLRLAKMPTVLDKIRHTERFWTLDAVQSLNGDGLAYAPEAFREIPGFEKDAPKMLNPGLDFEVIFRRCNEWYDKIEVVLSKPTRAERKAAADGFEKELKALAARTRHMTPLRKFFLMAEEPEKRRKIYSDSVASVLIGLMMPAIQKVSEAADRGEQLHRNGVIAAGLAAHFADKKTHPEKLSDLAPKYLPKLPDDVFSEKALIYKKTASGYLFYSVGVNLRDDGGKLLTDDPRGDDVGVRMPRK